MIGQKYNTAITKSFPPRSIDFWKHRHILDIDDFSKEEILLVFEIADAMAEILTREVKKVPTLRGKIIVNLFYEPSTRTRSSFELAAKNLSADTINLDSSKSSVMKGESLINSLRTIQALGADIVVMRHYYAGAPYIAAKYLNVSIINAGDGVHAHPSQALLDIYTMKQCLGDLNSRKITIVGDILHSRVARSNIWGLTKMGANIVLCGPPTLISTELIKLINYYKLTNIIFESNIEKAVKDADVIMPLRLQIERQQKGLLSTIREYIRLYQINPYRLSLAKPHAIIMHPGPINEDLEISSEVACGPQSVIERQVNNGIAIRMALFYLIAGGKTNNAK